MMAESDTTTRNHNAQAAVYNNEEPRGAKRKLEDTEVLGSNATSVQSPTKKLKSNDSSDNNNNKQGGDDYIFSNISADSSWQDQSFSLSRPRINQNNRPRSNKKKKKINNGQKWFQYGNYPDYYDYRTKGLDPRIKALKKEWFENKKCLDIGCNSGKFTIDVGKLIRMFLAYGCVNVNS